MELAKTHNIKEIDALLGKYATHLLEDEKVISAVELYPVNYCVWYAILDTCSKYCV